MKYKPLTTLYELKAAQAAGLRVEVQNMRGDWQGAIELDYWLRAGRKLRVEVREGPSSVADAWEVLQDYLDGRFTDESKELAAKRVLREHFRSAQRYPDDAVAWMVKRENDNDRAYIYQDEKTARLLAIDGGTVTPLFAHSQSTLSVVEIETLKQCERDIDGPEFNLLDRMHFKRLFAALRRHTSAAKPVEGVQVESAIAAWDESVRAQFLRGNLPFSRHEAMSAALTAALAHKDSK